EYRAAMRSGIIDSVEDLDVVLLAKEIGGTILSADEGILNMADSLGIEVFSSKDFIIKFGAAEGS
ncbi:MAG TPA: PIN domain-containing protein, partial [Spirochaetota bacterium]|nr:PIN domain-containing protein [Spirochaetota bacterium]